MKKSISLLLVLLMALLIFASCGNSSNSKSGYSSGILPSSADGAGFDKNTADEAYPDTLPAKDTSTALVDDTRKIIKTFRIDMEAKDFDKLTSAITAEVAAMGGYISDSTLTGGKTSDYAAVRRANYTVRVPSSKAEAFIERISGEGNVLRSTLSTDDITDAYFDYKARLDSLVLQEERLLAMLEKAATLDYMLQIEDKLASVRAQINSIHSQMQRMDKSVDYSFIYLSVNEVVKYQPVTEPTYFTKLGDAFAGAFAFFGDFFSSLLLGIVWALPFLLLAAVIVTVIIVLKRRRKAKKQASDKQE